jgi:phosphoribosylamine--glycine ligase
MVDDLEAAGLAVFGPRKAAARIESSKSFAKEMMTAAGVPTARSVTLTSADEARLEAAAEALGGYPIVLKYDGLALGKGVRICADPREALEFAREIVEGGRFKKAGSKAKSNEPVIVAEQFLTGHEVSLFALTDGRSYVPLEPACDHKRLSEGNVGPNTGGMGAYSPVPWLSKGEAHAMTEKIFPPLLEKLREAKIPFRGLLYAGLMVKGEEFWVLEFNARFGDPETQAVLPRLKSDLLPLLYGIAHTGSTPASFERNFDANPLRWATEACVNIVAASRGYPEKPETGFTISGLENAGRDAACRIFYAGVKAQGTQLVTSGGRVLGVSCMAESLDQARSRAIAVLESMSFEGMSFRRDIGSVY